jgi:O-antigen ligase/polysaccharide polymerase Wzy-like membrane protein
MAEGSMPSLSRPRSSIPDPTLLLFLMAGLLVWATQVTDQKDAFVLAGVALLPVGIWLLHWLTYSAEVGIGLLLVAAAMPRGAIDVGGLNLRPEHIAVGLLCLALPVLLRRRPQEPALWMFADYALAVYVGLNILSSLVASPAPLQTLKWSTQQTLAILPYFFLRLLAADQRRFRWAFRAFLLVGALEAAYGVVAYYANYFLGTEFGVSTDFYGTLAAPYGTLFEPNIFAAYCGAFSVAMLALFLQERRRIYLAGYGVTLAGMAVGLSRAALGATLIGLLLLAYCARRMRLLDWRVVRSVAVATLCVGIVILPAVTAQYSERLSTVDVTDPTADPNTLFRVVQFEVAVDDIYESPLLGNGTASFQLLYDPAQALVQIGAEVPWIANTELRVLHDTGVIGFVTFVLFVAALFRRARRRLRQVSDPALLALTVSSVVYLVSFQATEGTILAFTWVHLGMIACAVALAAAGERDAAAELGSHAGSDLR